MALTYNAVIGRINVGNKNLTYLTVTGDSSYVTGGYVLSAAGLTVGYVDMIIPLSPLANWNNSGGAGKLQLNAFLSSDNNSPGNTTNELPSGSNAANYTIPLLVYSHG